MDSDPFGFRNRISKWMLVGFIYGVIFILSSVPGKDFPEMIKKIPDLIPHFIVFALLAFFIMRALPAPKRIWLALLTGSALGVLDEIHQLFVSNRFFTLADIAADIAGVSAGIFLYSLAKKKARVRNGF